MIRGPAIVTGGAQGLGRAFCQAFADSAVPVVVADIDGQKAERVAAEIGGRALSVCVDIANAESVASMTEKTIREFGGVGVLINNAAIFSTLTLKRFDDITVDEWRSVIDVNVTGTFHCCRSVAPTMRAAGYGKIVNISSATVWTGRSGYLHYVTSKAALIGLTRALASEVGTDGICVNAITPGSTQTEIERVTITPEARQAMATATALRRNQTPDDLIGAVLFLSSTASDFITGQTINVDGGLAYH